MVAAGAHYPRQEQHSQGQPWALSTSLGTWQACAWVQLGRGRRCGAGGQFSCSLGHLGLTLSPRV